MKSLKFCEECFSNIEIQAIIKSFGTVGHCDINRNHTDVHTVEIENDTQMTPIRDILRQIIDIYKPKADLPANFPMSKLKSLHDSLATKWSIFNLNGESIYTIIAELYKNDENIDKRLLQEFVGVKEEFVTDNHKLIVKDNDWDKFANAIKYQNRFHTQNINLQLLNHFLKFTESIIKPEDFLLYRCRISNSEPIDISGMYAPPKEKASAGRLNSQWISHLYLGDDELACIQEVRAGFHDNVYIGEFKLKEPIKVVDLRHFEDKTLDFRDELQLEYYLNRDTFIRISNELAKPANNDDKYIHYLPLQYMSDFIKSSDEKFQGILYKIVMNENATNLLLFNPNLVECERVKKKTIKYIDYQYSR